MKKSESIQTQQTVAAAAAEEKKDSQKKRIYEHIHNSQNGISDRKIAEELDINLSMVNQYCRKLVGDGFVERRAVGDVFSKRILNFPVAPVDGAIPVGSVSKSSPSSKWRNMLKIIELTYGLNKDAILEQALNDYSRKLTASNNA